MESRTEFKLKPVITKKGFLDPKLLILIGLLVSVLVSLDTVAFKILTIGPFIMPGGIFFFAITWLITDITTEVWGRRVSYKIVLLGVMSLAVASIVYTIAVLLQPAPFWKLQPEFARIFMHVPRIMFASIFTFFVTELFDVWAFWKVRVLTKGKHLWIRNNVSTIGSNFFNGIIFTTIAFAGTVPQTVLINMVVTQVLFKWGLALIDTPLCYLGVWWARKE